MYILLLLLSLLSFNSFADSHNYSDELSMSVRGYKSDNKEANFWVKNEHLGVIDEPFISYSGSYKSDDGIYETRFMMDNLDKPISYLNFRRSLYSNNTTNILGILGTVDDFHNFYGSSSYQSSALLPQGVYNQQFISSGAFIKHNGVSLHLKKKLFDTLYSGIKLDYGKPYVENYELLENSLLGFKDPFMNIELPWMYQITFMTCTPMDELKFFASKAITKTIGKKQGNWTNADVYKYMLEGGKTSAALLLDPEYYIHIERFGISYAVIPEVEFFYEHVKLSVENDTFDPPGSRGEYTSIHWYIEDVTLIVGVSHATPDDGVKQHDDWIAVVVPVDNNITVTGEYHSFNQRSWTRYTETEDFDSKWGLFILTVQARY